MREIVLDTETTGLNHGGGDRVVEIGCVELVNYIPSGETFHAYVNPERAMPPGAERIHGLSDAFLRDKPLFAEVAEALLEFVAGDRVVAHNAEFDIGFLNAELSRAGRPPLANPVVDSVRLARRRFPGAPASLDALCERFGIDASAREKHGALLDAHLLAEVYLELVGGRQPALGLVSEATSAAPVRREPRAPRPHAPTAAEVAAHAAFLAGIAEPIWNW